MSLLLDTHVVLWWLAGSDRLPVEMGRTIADPDNTVFVSAASAWEMAIKSAIGKLAMPANLQEALSSQGFDELPVSLLDGLTAGALPRHHDDPFDRMLVAQALRRDLRVLTVDRQFADYGVRLG